MQQIAVGTPVQDQNGLIGRILAVDDDPETGAVALLVQERSGELRRLAPDSYELMDQVVVITAERLNHTSP